MTTLIVGVFVVLVLTGLMIAWEARVNGEG